VDARFIAVGVIKLAAMLALSALRLSLCRSTSFGFFLVAPLRMRDGLRQQGVVLFFALDGMSKLMP
jgi:hypothetical protein